MAPVFAILTLTSMVCEIEKVKIQIIQRFNTKKFSYTFFDTKKSLRRMFGGFFYLTVRKIFYKIIWVIQLDINNFRKFCSERKIRWTAHGLARLQERNISVSDVKNCIMNGEIIEEYPTDFPNPSALIFGKTLQEKILHVVCGIDENFLYLVTAYYPTTEKFFEDLKTRR